MTASDRLRLGEAGEDLACAILRRHGYEVLARNWRFGHLELDIICQKEDQIVFVEVKTRRNRAHGGGAGAITPAKKRRLWRAAQAWLASKNLWARPCRFDVICLTGAGDSFCMEHYRNAFELFDALGSGDSHWQQW